MPLPTTPLRRRRRIAAGTVMSAALISPVLQAPAAQAAPCVIVINPKTKVPHCVALGGGGSGGGGGRPGGGPGGSGPVEPPTPDGLAPDEGIGFVGVPGQPPQAAPITTGQLLEMAMTAAPLPVPKVHTAPSDKTYVRLRTSLWVEGFRDVPIPPVSAGGQTVAANAEAVGVDWDLGENKLACDNGGSKDGKSCSYIYKRSSTGQPGGSYEVTATIKWRVTWTCTGSGCEAPSGSLGLVTMTSAPAPLTVGEIQTNTDE